MNNEKISQKNKCIIFGGTGFIGSHFAKHLIENNFVDEVYLVDIKPIRPFFSFDNNKVHYVELDVRKPIDPSLLPSNASLIANFAAIHREPGHEDYEYYETNLYGADNVCAWAGYLPVAFRLMALPNNLKMKLHYLFR